MKTLTVTTPTKSYPIFIGTGISQQNILSQHAEPKEVVIVTNTTMAQLYPELATTLCPGHTLPVFTLPDGEQYKTLETVNKIFGYLLKNKYARTTTLVAFGGGVIGDMVGFSAACYQRGIQFIQCPTTLLAQVDSSVGGKTGVNHSLGKNMIGAFYQPECVIADLGWLGTLPNREYAAGVAEVIKYGLILDQEFFQWLEENIEALMNKESQVMAEAIYRSCMNKAEVVNADEKEQGVRATLNLGHTFGHAIETCTQYKEYLHGEAVAIGMVMAVALSVRLGYIDEQVLIRTKALLEKAMLPTALKEPLNSEDLINAMRVDKKALHGKMRFVILKSLGQADIQQIEDDKLLAEVLMQYMVTS